MDYRNLTRYYVSSKALSKVDKFGVILCLLVHWENDTLVKMDQHLTRFGRRRGMNAINDKLKDLVSSGHLNKSGSSYSLTLEGINLLNDLEKRIRETRYDK